MGQEIPVSVVIPTRNRATVLRHTLESLARQTVQPSQIVLIDGSENRSTYELCVAKPIDGLVGKIEWYEAAVLGAATQRNQAMQYCRHPVIGFLDDDILIDPDCFARLWAALQSDSAIGGVNAMVTNQNFQAPGRVSRLMFALMAGECRPSYAGALFGPAINTLPADDDRLPDVVPVQWLNTTCTLYRREALPDPPFPPFFTGYSMMEDATLSIRVGRTWKLANARTARIFHDSQSGEHKNDPVAFARMELVNRHHVMAHVLGRRRIRDYAKLALWEIFQLFVCALQQGMGREFRQKLKGKWSGLREIVGRGQAV